MLKVENLCKEYEKFQLKNVSFELPKGYIMGFIGRNGAGKTTTLKCILNLARKTSGKVEILNLNMDECELEIKERIGFSLGEASYYSGSKISKVAKVFKRFFKNWNEEKYLELLKRFDIDVNKKIKELSSGMKTKLSIAFALSHNAELLIFDEPTSGIDPVARVEILEIFQQVVSDGEHSIVFSTHITSDLDKCADYIVYIQDGHVILNETKDELLETHRVVAGKTSELSEIQDRLIGYKTNVFGFNGLILRDKLTSQDKIQIEKPNLEDIMLFYNKETI